MAQALYELPEGWAHKTIGQITTLITKGSTPTSYGYKFQSSGINFIKIENIVDGKVTSQSITSFISEGAHEYLKRSQLKENDLLFSIAGSIGTSAIVDNTILPANTNQALALIRGYEEYAIPSFFLYSLRSEVLNETKSKSRGGALQNISLTDIKNTKIPLPPLNEQKRIVAKLDALFTRIDTAITHLQQTLELSKALFASALNEAFQKSASTRGVLTDVVNFIGGSQPPKAQFSDTEHDGYVRLIQIRDYKSDAYKVYVKKESTKKFCSADDVMIGRYGPPVFQILRGLDGAYNVALMKAVPDEVRLSKVYLFWFLRSPSIQHYIVSISQRAAGQSGVNKKALEKYKIPLPTLDEQQGIVSHLESLSERIGILEISTREKLNDLTALKASLLDAAFKGQL